jgi:predicted transcriptional regulator
MKTNTINGGLKIMAKEKVAHVICNNDNIEAVVLEDKGKALMKMRELAFNRWKKAFYNYGARIEFEEYLRGRTEYWHIHSTKIS